VRELWRQLQNTHSWGYLVAAIAAGIVTGLLGRRWRATGYVVAWLVLASAGLVLIYWISTLPTSSNLTNSSYRTIVSLLVGGTSTLPLLIAPRE
jgi:biotin transporter BioY